MLNEELERDNLARRRAEEEATHLNAALEQRVRERTAELEIANQDLESFSYSVSHDLRAPLRAISGYSQILLEDEAPRLQVGDLPVAAGDRTMLEQVLQNLIGNALKYSAQKHAAEVSVGAREEHGRTVYFVRDNGVGFDMAHATHLFGMFRRLHGDTEFPGTGVGLAIVKRLVERLGGQVWAQAEPDRGATFCFTVGRPELAGSAVAAQ